MHLRASAAFLLLAAVSGFSGSCKSPEIEATAYFLVAEAVPLHNDSYILPLTDPDHIARAEAMLAGREPSQIVVARIARGSGDGDHLNRNLAAADRAPWSWHVAAFVGFADITAEILDGWPGYVEEHLDEWLAATDATIGFWSYRIRRRVDAAELK